MSSCERLLAALPISSRNYLKTKVLSLLSPAKRSEPERLTQVHLTDLGVGKDFFRSPGGDDGALIDDVGAAADPQGFAHIMVSDEHADAALRSARE